MPILDYFKSKEKPKDDLPKDADVLLRAIGDSASLNEDMRKNSYYNIPDQVQNKKDWAERDAGVQKNIDTLNAVITKEGITSEQLMRWMEANTKSNSINYSQRFWMNIVNGKPFLELNHFYKFHYGMERAKIAKELKNPTDRNEYLRILNDKIAVMEPKAAPGELEKFAKANGLDVKNGQLVFSVKK